MRSDNTGYVADCKSRLGSRYSEILSINITIKILGLEFISLNF